MTPADKGLCTAGNAGCLISPPESSRALPQATALQGCPQASVACANPCCHSSRLSSPFALGSPEACCGVDAVSAQCSSMLGLWAGQHQVLLHSHARGTEQGQPF